MSCYLVVRSFVFHSFVFATCSKKSSMAEPMLLNSSEVTDFPPAATSAGVDNVTGNSVAFRNVTYEVTQRDWCYRELMPKAILTNIR